MTTQKDIDHANIETERTDETAVQNAANDAANRIGTPVSVLGEFEWIYSGLKLRDIAFEKGVAGDPEIKSLIALHSKLTSAEFVAELSQRAPAVQATFNILNERYIAERAKDSNWWMKPLDSTIKAQVAMAEQVYRESLESFKLGTLSKDVSQLMADVREDLEPFMAGTANRSWFLMRNNAQTLVDTGFQEICAGLRRIVSANEWNKRARSRDNANDVERSIGMLEDARHQKVLGAIQLLVIGAVYDTLIDDEHAYKLRFVAQNGVREALGFEAWKNMKKFNHPGVVDSTASAAGNVQDVILQEAMGGI